MRNPSSVVSLRAFARDDIPLIVGASQDWRALAESGPPYWRPRSAAEVERKVASMAGPALAPEYNFVVDRGTRMVGECSIHSIDYRNRVAQVGVCLWNPADRGHGVGGTALRQLLEWSSGYLGIRRHEAWVVVGNQNSRLLVERAGFQHEGTLRARYLADGQFHDILLFAMVSE